MTTPTPETDACASRSAQPRYVSIDFARKLERERDAARAALSIARRERESARQAISMADGTLVQIVAELGDCKNNYQTAYCEWQQAAVDRDAWKAKAESLIKACRDQAWTHDVGQSRGTYCACPVCQIIKEHDACGGRIVKED